MKDTIVTYNERRTTSMANDMISGNPGKTLFFFAVPMVLGNVFQQLYSIVDSIIVGKFVGPDALAAVGASTAITFLFIAFATGISIGSCVFISQLFGAGQYGRMKTAISTILISVFVLSSFLMVFGLLINKSILKFMNTPSNILEDAQTYLQIYFLGIVFLFMYNILTSIYNALGESKTPLYFLILSSFLNIALDLLFVIEFQMGVSGVAWATLIAQGVSVTISGINLLRRIKKMNIQEDFRYFDKNDLINISKIAIPSTIQQSILSIGMLLVQTLVNGYGSVVIAGYTAGMKIDSIAISPMVNVGSAVSTFTAQNIGANKIERVRKGHQAALIMVAVIGLTIAGLLFLFGDAFIACFVDAKKNPEVVKVGVAYLRVVSIFYFVMGAMNVTNGVLRGATDMNAFMICTLINLSVRVIFAYMASTIIGAKAIWWAIPVGWLVGFIFAYLRLRSGKWEGKSVLQDRK